MKLQRCANIDDRALHRKDFGDEYCSTGCCNPVEDTKIVFEEDLEAIEMKVNATLGCYIHIEGLTYDLNLFDIQRYWEFEQDSDLSESDFLEDGDFETDDDGLEDRNTVCAQTLVGEYEGHYDEEFLEEY